MAKNSTSKKSQSNTTTKRDALNRMKIQAASEVGVTLRSGYNGNLTSKQAGSIGGQMVKRMIEAYSNGSK